MSMDTRRWWLEHAWGTVLANYAAYGLLFWHLELPYWWLVLMALFIGQQIINAEFYSFKRYIYDRANAAWVDSIKADEAKKKGGD